MNQLAACDVRAKPTTMMKRPRAGWRRRLAEFTPGLIAEALAARGLGEASLIADWPAIVGETFARHARPIELQWPPRATKRDPETPARPATLVLRVEGSFALEAPAQAPSVYRHAAGQRQHLGWRCVEQRSLSVRARCRRSRIGSRPCAGPVRAAQRRPPRRAAAPASIENERLCARAGRATRRTRDRRGSARLPGPQRGQTVKGD